MEPSDEELMLRYQEGDDGAFEVLFARYSGPVYGFLMRMTAEAALAEDLTQTTFTSLVRARDRFSPGIAFKPWLFTIATNAAREHHRNKQVRVRSHDALKAESTKTTEQPDFDPGLQRAVNEAIGQLPAAQREAVVLHKVQGLSFEEIGQMLGVTASAARIKAHRGYARLRDLLSHLKD